MLPLTALPNIDPQKTQYTREILDDLLVNAKLISGYNWYTTVPLTSRVVTISHMHETEAYKNAMFRDIEKLGYRSNYVESSIRTKFSSFSWPQNFLFRDEQERIFPNLWIRRKTGEFIDLSRYAGRTLENVVELTDEHLIGENKGWELNMTFREKQDLLQLVNLFLKKFSQSIPGHWPGAYDVPVLVIGKSALEYACELPDFLEVKKILLVENGNEISFIVNEKLNPLKNSHQFIDLTKQGFIEELCLANRIFIESYVDKR